MATSLYKNIARATTIIRVFARHGVFSPLENGGLLVGSVARFLGLFADSKIKNERMGRRVTLALEALGPTFVKFGQALSMRPDVVGQSVAQDLAQLRDNIPPFPGQEARLLIAEALGGPVERFYQSFDDQAVGAASIAQVHFAVTTEGKDVAVKVLRPGVEELFHADIRLFGWLARLSSRLFPGSRRLRLEEVVKTFRESIILEMDLRFEAAAAAEMAENFKDDPSVCIPEIDWQRTGKTVLTEERVTGISIANKDEMVKAGINLADVTVKSAEVFFNMVFRDGFFHADMHPGNLFVNEKGQLILVDFGIMGRLDYNTRRYLGEMLIGILTRDYRRVAEMHFEAGYVRSSLSIDAFTQAIRSIAEPIFGRPQNEISIARLLGQLFQVTETFDMEVQPQLLFLQKSMLVAEGLGRDLYPEANMWQLAAPLIKRWIFENLGPAARIRDAAEDLADVAIRLPGLLANLADTGHLSQDGIRLHPDTIRALKDALEEKRKISWTPWVAAAVLAALLLFGS